MKVKFSRCNSSNLADLSQVDGQLIYVKDTSELYLDTSNARNKVSDLIVVENKSTVTNPVLSKLYYQTSDDKLYKAKIVDENITWICLSGASTEYVDSKLVEAKTYTDTAIANYVPLRSFPSSVKINGTTRQFLNSIQSLNLPVGSMLLGLVYFTDMPVSGLGQAEVEVEVYKNNVLYCTMKSADVAPYIWNCNSYEYRGWEASNAPKATNTSYTNTSSGLSATTVQGAIDELASSVKNAGSALDSINGEVI